LNTRSGVPEGNVMWLRILLAGIVGGVLIFFMGAFNHMVLGLQGRTLQNVPESESFVELVKSKSLKPGLYVFPDMPTGPDGSDKAKYEEANRRYKEGPAGMLLIAPTGQDMMGGETLGKELATNVIAALFASWIVSLISAEVGFVRRWLAVFVIGIIGWFSFVASYGIWYRFPHNFVHDEFLCAVLEWGVAGVAIAAIVRRKANVPPPAGA
jgi:hypothetical protein